MSDSDYYYNCYQEAKREAAQYGQFAAELNKIIDALADGMDGEIRAVNRKLAALRESLQKSVRYSPAFDVMVDEISEREERTVSQDACLSLAVNRMEEEMARLERRRRQAFDDEDYYYDRYQSALEEERLEEMEQFWARKGEYAGE